MADVNRGARPLSPHLSIYRPQWTWIPSILHRITGVGVGVAAVLVVWWLLAAASGPDYFATADWVVNGWLGNIVMLLALFGLSYHFCNGIRHLWWDTGSGFAPEKVERSAQVTVAVSIVLALIVWIF